jgi:hypothetical protein
LVASHRRVDGRPLLPLALELLRLQALAEDTRQLPLVQLEGVADLLGPQAGFLALEQRDDGGERLRDLRGRPAREAPLRPTGRGRCARRRRGCVLRRRSRGRPGPRRGAPLASPTRSSRLAPRMAASTAPAKLSPRDARVERRVVAMLGWATIHALARNSQRVLLETAPLRRRAKGRPRNCARALALALSRIETSRRNPRRRLGSAHGLGSGASERCGPGLAPHEPARRGCTARQGLGDSADAVYAFGPADRPLGLQLGRGILRHRLRNVCACRGVLRRRIRSLALRTRGDARSEFLDQGVIPTAWRVGDDTSLEIRERR